MNIKHKKNRWSKKEIIYFFYGFRKNVIELKREIRIVVKSMYFDYSATTPVSDEVLDTFVQVCKKYPGNPNSLHRLGVESQRFLNQATEQVAKLLKVKPSEIIYTSGASESNNTVIKGVCFRYQNRGKHILTTPFEHSSIVEPLHYLEQFGFTVEYLPLLEDGTVDLEALENKMREDTILVTVASVSSELGILQPITEIAKIVKKYPKCFFHVDMTQNIGKVPFSLEQVDFMSMSAHKIYGLKGIGLLYKKEGIDIVPLIHGGKSTTKYRSGTPALPLIASLAKALRLSLEQQPQHDRIVEERNRQLQDGLKKIEGIVINSTNRSIPHIVNISVASVKPETLLHALEEKEIYVSTKSACATNTRSDAVYALTKDEKRALTTIRISLSHMTTEQEIETLLQVLKEEIERLRW